MFFGKKKEPQLPEPFGAEGSFGSADNEPPKNPPLPPLKMDEIKKAVTMPSLKPPIPPPKIDSQTAPAAPPFQPPPVEQAQKPPQPLPFQNPPQAPPKAFQPPMQNHEQPPKAFFQPLQAKPFPFQPNPKQEDKQPQENKPQTFPFQGQQKPPQFSLPTQQAPQYPNPGMPAQRAPPASMLQPPRMQPQNKSFSKPLEAEIPEEDTPFAQEKFETPAAAKKSDTEEEDTGEDVPEAEFHANEKPEQKTEKKQKPAIPRILPPPPPPHMETPEPETEKEEEHARHKQKKETLIEASQPELLRALVELLNKSATVQVVEALRDAELSLTELVNRTGIDENELKDVLHRFTCLGLIKEFWYKSAAGSHIRKYKLDATRGTIEFDLLALRDTLPIEELKAKSTRLVALITSGGRMPKSVLLRALPVMDEEQLEQVIRYTEKFKLPSIRDMLTVEAKISLDSKPAKQEEESGGEEKPPEVTDLYYEIENIQKSLGELE